MIQEESKSLADILIVDDDAFSVFSLQSILKANFGVDSDYAYNGE